MGETQSWSQVVAELKRRLAARKYPTRLWWVFREDMFEIGPRPFVVCRRPARNNSALAETVFRKGHALGFVRIVAIGRLFNVTLATVWYPDVPEAELKNWGHGAWIKIRNPLRRAIWVPKPLWIFLRLTASYRVFQSEGWQVATKRWARRIGGNGARVQSARA